VKRPVYLGVDIGGTNTKLAIVSASGRVFSRAVIATLPRHGSEVAFKRIKGVLPFLMSGTQELMGVGVGCAGLVDREKGRLISSPNLPKWNHTPLRKIAKEALGVPAVIDNDAAAAAYGEYVKGVGKGCTCFICITLGTGVGGGVVIGGKMLRGASNFAGEIGHVTIDESGPSCACGNRGCLEAYVGAGALVRSAREKMKTKRGRILGRSVKADTPTLSPRVITEAAVRGDRIAKEVLDEAAGHLGSAIASLVNIFNPQVVAVGGGVAGAFHIMKPRLEKEVYKRSFVAPMTELKIVRALLGNDASTTGAAMMVKKHLKGILT
jgi:glucokinase